MNLTLLAVVYAIQEAAITLYYEAINMQRDFHEFVWRLLDYWNVTAFKNQCAYQKYYDFLCGRKYLREKRIQFYEYVNGNGTDAFTLPPHGNGTDFSTLPPDVIKVKAQVCRFFYHNFHLDWPCFVSTLTGIYFRLNDSLIALSFPPHSVSILLWLFLGAFLLYCCCRDSEAQNEVSVPVVTHGVHREDHDDESSEDGSILGLEPLNLTELQVARISLKNMFIRENCCRLRNLALESENLDILRMHAALEYENVALEAQNLMLLRTLG
jgi:hypothetical protein